MQHPLPNPQEMRPVQISLLLLPRMSKVRLALSKNHLLQSFRFTGRRLKLLQQLRPSLPAQRSRLPISNPFTALQNGTWLHGRSEKDVFRLLIDVYRMRVEDMYTQDGDVDEDSIYSGYPDVDGRAGFRRYLKKVERHKNGALLPKWWNEKKREECIAYGGPKGKDEWAKLECAVEKSDINEHYGDPQFAMQLRMFTEAVDGRGPGGAKGDFMRQMMMMMMEEKGVGMCYSKMDANGNIVPY